MTDASANIAIVRSLYRALESGQHGAELARLFSDDVVTVEHPNLIKPKGARVAREGMLAGAAAGVGLLSRQKYDVHSMIEHGDMVIVRLLWSGTIARDVGPFRAGQELSAHIAQFIELRDGRVAAIETYDCYEPFA